MSSTSTEHRPERAGPGFLRDLSEKTRGKSTKEIEDILGNAAVNIPQGALLPIMDHLKPGKDMHSSVQDSIGFEPLPEPLPGADTVMVIVPTKNQMKLKVAEDFMAARDSSPDCLKPVKFKVHGVNASSGVGEQPYSAESGMQGAWNRVHNAYPIVVKEWKEYLEAPEADRKANVYHNVSKILFFSFENFIEFEGNESSLRAFDHPAIIIYSPDSQIAIQTIGRGVLVPAYFLEIALTIGFEKNPDGSEDKRKGRFTVGKTIESMTKKKILGHNWHEWFSGKSRYPIILQDSNTLWNSYGAKFP